MLQKLRHDAWSFIHRTFPERQVYIRSDGRVQFFTFDPTMQAICAGAGIVVLGWVAFTSVNVIFKDRIIASKEQHFIDMQAAYEARLSNLQVSYDELNGALTAAEDSFQAVAENFEAKQTALESIIHHKQQLQSSLAGRAAPPPAARAPNAKSAYLGVNMGLGGPLEELLPGIAKSLTPSVSAIGPFRNLPAFSAASSQPADQSSASPAKSSTFLGGAVRRIGEFFGRPATRSGMDNVSIRHIAETEARIVAMDAANPSLAAETKQDIDKEVTRLTRIVRNTGLDPNALAAQTGASGQGGPLIPIGQALTSTSDEAFNRGVQGAARSLESLDKIVGSLQAIPLSTPLEDASVSSGFGGRSDPFTENFAYHSGVDFSGAKGTGVHVTAPGVVVFAERNGAYGNMVEVDHGNRVRTRYAHLLKIGVPVGKRLEKGDVVGELGSTGRSTGPHVHYEVWYDKSVKDPQRFIRAGRDVFKDQ
jgi:murein DD-endopeptidase MepM/ murein hydrolase activator NlpD